ncbi:MAG: peptidoglycan recognition protein family protein [Bacteroidales bacterium]|nr:peptidoglycan recognition protein family protein [Bacteroidales bacterium]
MKFRVKTPPRAAASHYEGRPHNTIGAHAYGVNSKSVGICFEGDFNKEELTDNQEKAAIVLITLLSFAYPDAKLCRHCDLTTKKNCPGNNFPFERIREKVIKSIKEMRFSNSI